MNLIDLVTASDSLWLRLVVGMSEMRADSPLTVVRDWIGKGVKVDGPKLRDFDPSRVDRSNANVNFVSASKWIRSMG